PQVPNKLQIPMHQISNTNAVFGNWILSIGICLEIVGWKLELRRGVTSESRVGNFLVQKG
ncbi:MAG: hypothetical protein Q8R39_02030, partial [bacterium]|nr:hypothetical protein [bacterium]